jgi:hypothetical protein
MRRTTTAAASVVLVIALTSCMGLGLAQGACTGPSDLVIEDPKQAVQDAHALIAKQKQVGGNAEFLNPEQLPHSLRVRGLRWAHVHHDHVDLVLARNPDWEVGGRIWAPGHRLHKDPPARYDGVHFFQHTNDAPESPDNIH